MRSFFKCWGSGYLGRATSCLLQYVQWWWGEGKGIKIILGDCQLEPSIHLSRLSSASLMKHKPLIQPQDPSTTKQPFLKCTFLKCTFTLAVEVYMPYWSKEKGGLVVWMSKEKKAIHMEMKKQMSGKRMLAGPSLTVNTEGTLVKQPCSVPPCLSYVFN